MASAPRQLQVLRRHLPMCCHYRQTSTIQCDLVPSQTDDKSLVTQVVQLLQVPENEWNADQLHPMLFSATTMPCHLLTITLHLGSSSKAFNFLEYVRANAPSEQSYCLSPIFHGVLELFSKEPVSEYKLLEIYKRVKQWHIPLTSRSATLLIQCLRAAKMVDELLLLFNDLDPSVKKTHVVNTLISALFRLGLTESAVQALDEMCKPNTMFPPNKVTGNIVLAELLKRQSPVRSITDEEIGQLVRKLSEHGVFPDTIKLTHLITKLCQKQKTWLAWDLLHDVMKMGGAVEATSCNALLTGLGKDRDVKKMNDLLAKMKEMDIQPNVITFGILINRLCKSRRIDDALKVLEEMRGKGGSKGMNVEPDVVIFNTLIDGLCKVGRLDESLSLLEQMKNDCRPNTITYNCLIDGFCKASNLDKAHELFDQMNKEGVIPNVVTLNTLIDGMCRHGRISSAVEFFNEMRRKGIKGNSVTYTSLISAFCHVNNIDKAVQYFDMMLSSGCSPDVIVFYSLISGLSLAGRMDDATFVVSKLKEAGFGLDLCCYNVLISGFCKKKKLERVYEMLQEMERTGVKPDIYTYNTLISFLGKNGDFKTACEMLRKMKEEGLFPSVVTYGAVIHAYCLHGNVDEAMKMFREMSSALKVPPNTVIYNILIDSLCKIKDVESALFLMDDMKVKGIRPNTTTYNAILKGIQDKKMLHKAFELMNRMVEDACRPDYVTVDILTEWLSAVGEMKKLKTFLQGYKVSCCTAKWV
ncbi:pentatricopeptide repeat-containing protein At5g28460 [Neltuma alba]|uniref:pentatricopeptide repeat-containing protein At5g28460 n=1 Tax=Neltuma alba TaxID=207710 RepID=UPI0010A3ED77|nr:pentatricopeptide repeat-containing protein At5g28460-like [Prosopis alba]